MQQQRSHRLTATVHLRRAAVLLELCLLQPNNSALLYTIGCLKHSWDCMYCCVRAEHSSDAEASNRVRAAFGNGILPALLQQLLPVVPLLLQQAEQGSFTARAVGELLSRALLGGLSFAGSLQEAGLQKACLQEACR